MSVSETADLLGQFQMINQTLYTTAWVVGSVLLMTTNGVYSLSGVRGSMVGYIMIMVGLMLLFMQMVSFIINQYNSGNKVEGMWRFVFSIIPILGISYLLLYYIRLYYTNQDKISGGNIASEFTTYVKVSNLLFFFILGILIYATRKDLFKKQNQIDMANASFLYLLLLLSIADAYILNTILVFYTTDG